MTAAKSEAVVGLGLPILVLGIPIFDTLFSILRRFLDRRGIMSPDRGHFHHRLLALGLNQKQVAIIAYVVTLLVTGMGFFMITARSTGSVLIFFSCLTLLLLLFRMVGAVRLHETLAQIRRRSEWSRREHLERKLFEEAQLHFRDARTFDQWWACICKAAAALEFAKVCLELATRDNGGRTLMWQRPSNGEPQPGVADLVHMEVPVKDRREAKVHRIEIDVLTRGSLQSASHRAALFARLAEEHGLDSLPQEAESGKR